jgi:hypothetical protein
MFRSHRIIQDTRPETFLPLEKPLQPALPVAGKSQKKFLLMASMGYAPDAAHLGEFMVKQNRNILIRMRRLFWRR